MTELHGTVRLGRLKRIQQVVYYYRYPDDAPFELNGTNEFDYIRKGRGQNIPVRFDVGYWDLEKYFKLAFLEKITEITQG